MYLFNYVFTSCIFPTDWADGLLIPLHKKGNRSDPSNLRLFTRIMNKRLDTWAEDYGIYIEAQYGFRKGRSTTDCMFILSNIINKFTESGHKLYAFFVDYSKAFDYIVRQNLWYKLVKCGVQGKILNIIMSMYNSVKTRVFVNGVKSDMYECKLGVRQGECVSPFLFAMYINDLEEKLSSDNAGVTVAGIKILLLFYADDVVIFSETPLGLQNEIDKLYDYCITWKLKLNTDKSQIVIFRKGNRPVRYNWHFGDHPLITRYR